MPAAEHQFRVITVMAMQTRCATRLAHKPQHGAMRMPASERSSTNTWAASLITGVGLSRIGGGEQQGDRRAVAVAEQDRRLGECRWRPSTSGRLL
jgi:hypothetical protein